MSFNHGSIEFLAIDVHRFYHLLPQSTTMNHCWTSHRGSFTQKPLIRSNREAVMAVISSDLPTSYILGISYVYIYILPTGDLGLVWASDIVVGAHYS